MDQHGPAIRATHVVNASEGESVSTERELSDDGVHHALEAVGSGRTAGQALATLRPEGIATVIGMIPESDRIPIKGTDLFFLAKQLRGSFMGSNRFKVDIPCYVELSGQGRLQLGDMVTDRLPFREIHAGFELLASGSPIRVVVDVGDIRSKSC